jgi:putative aldouronate transport system substrate-binding protein
LVKHGKRRVHAAMLLCIVMLVLTALGGCTSPEKTQTLPGQANEANGTNVVSQTPKELSMMVSLFVAEPPKENNEVWMKLEESTGTQLKVTWVPSSAYNDKVNATIASGEIPQVLLVTNDRSPSIINAIRSGMFWEVGPYLKDFPNLSKLNEQVLNNIAVDGKVFGLYRGRPIPRNGVILRKDWLDKLGLQEPKNVEQLVSVIRSFAQKDPDGNGKADTYGLAEDKGLASFANMLVYMGGPNGWEVKDQKMSPDFMSPAYMETLKLYRGLYTDKVMNQDFAAVTDRYTMVTKGVSGLHVATLTDAINRMGDFSKLHPEGKWDVLVRVEGAKGIRTPATSGYNGVFMFPKTSVKTEAELKQILTFYDRLTDRKNTDLMVWGLEGVHNKVEDGKPVWIDKQAYTNFARPFYQMSIADETTEATQGKLEPLEAKINNIYKNEAAIGIPNPTWSLLSQTATERGTELQKIIDDARTKFIMGAIDEQGWNQAVQQWTNSGGSKIIEEYTAEYGKTKKK